MTSDTYLQCEHSSRFSVLRLKSEDGTNRLRHDFIVAMRSMVSELSGKRRPLILTGGRKFFSVGADLKEIAALNGSTAFEFARNGQSLMNELEQFPAPVYAAISGHCMGGGLDLALACRFRVASPDAILGHRGASLGLITGWGGTQRLPRLIGTGPALQMLVAAEQVTANLALKISLVDAIADDPVAEAARQICAVCAAGIP